MEFLIRSQVFFRSQKISQEKLLPLVDVLLVPWLGEVQCPSAIQDQIQYYENLIDSTEYKRSPSIIAQLFGVQESKPDISGAISAVSDIRRRSQIVYPEAAKSTLSEFFDRYLGVSDEWREDVNAEWHFSEDEVAALYNICLWTIRQIEVLAESMIEKYPNDIGAQDLLAKFRSLAFLEIEKFSEFALNLDQFKIEVGSERYCVSKAYAMFWSELGYDYRACPANRVDHLFANNPEFINYLGDVSAGLRSHLKSSGLTILDRCYLVKLQEDIQAVLRIWDNFFTKNFHLGPSQLLRDQTLNLLERVETLLKSDESSQVEGGKMFREKVSSLHSEFSEASTNLTKALKPVEHV